jgi:hypothetical protein
MVRSYMKPENYPSSGDSIFPPTNRFEVRIPEVDGRWQEYADSYKAAADILASQDSAAILLLEPTIFLYRHLLELRLKSIVALGFVAKEDACYSNKLKDLLGKHDLKRLLGECRTLCESHGVFNGGRRLRGMFAATEKCIIEFADIDPGSYSFRYPVDKQLQPSVRRPFNFSAAHVRKIAGKLDNFLKLLQERMEEIVDGNARYIDDLDAENQRSRKEHFGIDEAEADMESQE